MNENGAGNSREEIAVETGSEMASEAEMASGTKANEIDTAIAGQVAEQTKEIFDMAKRGVDKPEVPVSAPVGGGTGGNKPAKDPVGGGTGGNEPPAGGGTGGGVADEFVGLPIESLICGPIIAAAKGQQELTAVYVDGIRKLAFAQDTNGNPTDKTSTISMKVPRIVKQQDQQPKTQEFTIEAPVLSLVPVPAFLMNEMTVDFNMEVKQQTLDKSSNHADLSAEVNYKSWWGVDAKITGNVSADSMHKRTTDSSATYHVTARAVQQPPTEGMTKLTHLLAEAMEPIE